MSLRPTLSNLIYTKRQIIIHAFAEKEIHPGNFIPLELKNIEFKNHLSLKYANITVGRFQREIFHRDQNSIYLYFENIQPNINLDNLWASMQISPKIIKCPMCNTFFNKNETPCKCIKGAPFYYFANSILESVHLHHHRIDNLDSCDYRKQIYSEFFERTMHNLTFMEPI